MTKNSFDKFRDVGSPLTEWTIPAEDGVHRRTIVKGAAWTIPVVAVAVATPAAAASKTPTLAFTKASYSGVACGTITGVQVKRTSDGTTADAGQVITVTLKDGYKFKDGSTTYSATSGTDGTITLPDIIVPAAGGDSTFNATSGTLSASAPVKTAKAKIAHSQQYGANTASTTYAAPQGDGLTAVGYGTFLNTAGQLFHNETEQATGVTSAVGENNGTYDTATYVENGVAKAQEYGTKTTTTTYKAPTGAGLKAVGYATFLNDAGTLWHNEV
ncbi:hypothetical protein HRF29_11910, partial [Rathayibacter agropyri]|nr:hypothetical protein [Rathayibacter agropyri]